jgi:hypothetical protein
MVPPHVKYRNRRKQMFNAGVFVFLVYWGTVVSFAWEEYWIVGILMPPWLSWLWLNRWYAAPMDIRPEEDWWYTPEVWNATVP